VITYNVTNDRAVSVLNNAANLAININYKPFGGVSSLTYGNGIVGMMGYDNQYRIASITAGTALNLTYADDASGNITGITNTLDATNNKSFTYDTLDRLTGGTGSWGSLGWTYDGVGNRQTENTNSYTYTANTNKLNSANGKSYGYDNNGNTTTENARIYTYNQNQRLIQVTDGAMTVGYTYNGNGQRVKKAVNGVTTIFHYNLGGQLIAESNSAGSITAEYVYLNGQPLTKIEGSVVYYYHNDHLATPQKMTDGSGTVVWSADYKPFGEVTVTVSTITNNLRFPGQYYDAETGLNYNYYRDYNPAIGRYIESDPIGLSGGMNLYVYAENQPINAVDPEGLQVAIDPSTGRRLPPPPPSPTRPPGYTPPFGDPVPGDKCLKCDVGAVLSCIWTRPATPSNAFACAKCIFTFNPYTGTYDQTACTQCGAAVGMIITDCINKNCREGKRDKCLKCQ
jgi:RHS repeat-associated protein